MDSKKQMYIRFILNASLSRTDLLSSMKSVLEDHITGIVINTNGMPDSFDIITEDDIDRDALYIKISTAIIDFSKRNFIVFKKIYEDYTYKNRDIKACLSKDDLMEILMSSEYNKFLFNLSIFNKCIRITFR